MLISLLKCHDNRPSEYIRKPDFEFVFISVIVRFIDIIAVHAVEIDRVVFLRGGDAAGEELP